MDSVRVSNFPDTQAVNLTASQTTVSTTCTLANNLWAQALSVTSGATSTLITNTLSTDGYQIKGLVGHGTGDGYFTIQINNVVVLSGRTRATMPNLILTLENGVSVSNGQTVKLTVTNESGSTADFEATLLGQ